MWPYADANFQIVSESVQELVSGAQETDQTIQDRIHTTYTGATVDNHLQLLTSVACTFESLTPSIATVDDAGLVSRVSNGTAQVLVKSFKANKRVAAAVSRTNPSSFSKFTRFAPGSLARHCADAIDDQLEGDLPLFAVMNHSHSIYERNPACWAWDIDLSGVSVWNNLRFQRKAGTLITRKHVIHAQHFGLHPGYVLRFVTPENELIEREVVAAAQLGGTDIRIATLDSDLPPSIASYAIMPADWADYLPSLDRGIPVLTTDQEKKAWVLELRTIAGDSPSAFCIAPTSEPRSAFTEAFVNGDSGNPAFLIVNGLAVLVTCWTSPGAGPAYCGYIDEITAMVAPYQVEVADFSAFPTYV